MSPIARVRRRGALFSLVLCVAIVGQGTVLSATAHADDFKAQATEVTPDPSYDNGWGYDARGDVIAHGASVEGGLVTVALTTRQFDNPETSSNWRDWVTGIIFEIDVNGDGVEDYDVFYANDGSSVFAQVRHSDSFTLMCDATPSWDSSARFYSATFPASCIGSPANLWLGTLMVYDTPYTTSDDTTALYGPISNRSDPPIGSLDGVSVAPSGIRVAGWALDPNTASAINVHVYVDGAAAGVLTANQSRPDIGSAYPSHGPQHGFSGTIGAAPGDHSACVYAINNASPGDNAFLGCRNVRVPDGSPIGSLDSATGQVPNKIRVSGWALDPSTTSAVDVHVYVDGTGVAVLSANQSRPDVARSYPAFGSQHGFSADVTVSTGTHHVCAYAINIGPGGNSLLGCRTSTINPNPMGSLDSMEVGAGLVRVRGWALDADTTDPIVVHFYAGSQLVGTATAGGSRPDIATAFPGMGANHGFDRTFNVPPGRTTVCAYGINVGRGGNSLIGCVTAQVPSGDPIGSIDAAQRVTGGIRVAGWTLDPNTSSPISVHIYVDGVGVRVASAAGSRPDVAAAYPGYGEFHGFDLVVATDNTGPHTICVYAINVSAGGNSLLGCRYPYPGAPT